MNVYGIQWIKGGRTIEAPAGYNLHDFFRSSIPDEITAPWWDANYLGADADGVGLLWDDSPARLGRRGGAARSVLKSSAARANGAKGGRPLSLTGGRAGLVAAINEAFRANLHNPTIRYSHSRGFFVESAHVPAADDVLWSAEANYILPTDRRSVRSVDYAEIKAEILG